MRRVRGQGIEGLPTRRHHRDDHPVCHLGGRTAWTTGIGAAESGTDLPRSVPRACRARNLLACKTVGHASYLSWSSADLLHVRGEGGAISEVQSLILTFDGLLEAVDAVYEANEPTAIDAHACVYSTRLRVSRCQSRRHSRFSPATSTPSKLPGQRSRSRRATASWPSRPAIGSQRLECIVRGSGQPLQRLARRDHLAEHL